MADDDRLRGLLSSGLGANDSFLSRYLETLSLVERLSRLLLDLIKDELERLGIFEINATQALLLFNINTNEVTAGELKSRCYYVGSNVSYNLKKLVDLGYMLHERCDIDRRSVRVRLTEKGLGIRDHMSELFERNATGIEDKGIIEIETIGKTIDALRRLERYWSDQIRYIY